MEKSSWYFIDTGHKDGAFNMAFDWILSRTELEYPVLRVFGWDPYTISIGYMQKIDDIKTGNLNGIGLVRRPTGGRAVFHSEELTYSVIVPRKNALYKKSNAEIYEIVHIALNEALNKIGVRTSLETRQTPYKKLTANPVCFSSKAKSEVQINGKKVIGSAQRRLKESLLQHGSILIGNYHLNIVNYLKSVSDSEKELLKQASVSIESILGKKIDYNLFTDIIKKSFEEKSVSLFKNMENIVELTGKAEKIKGNFNLVKSEK